MPNADPNPAGDGPMSRRNRGLLIAAGGLAAVVVAVLLLWLFAPVDADGGQGNPAAQAPGRNPAASARVPAGATNRPGATTANQQPANAPGPGPGVISDPSAPTATPTRNPDNGSAATPGPSSAEPSTSAAPSSGDSGDSGGTKPTKTISTTAGSVEARCTGGKAELTSWRANDPFTVERVNAGPVLAATAVFKKPGSRVRMTVTCVGDNPTAVVLPL